MFINTSQTALNTIKYYLLKTTAFCLKIYLDSISHCMYQLEIPYKECFVSQQAVYSDFLEILKRMRFRISRKSERYISWFRHQNRDRMLFYKHAQDAGSSKQTS